MIDRITKDEFGTSAPLAQNRLLPAVVGSQTKYQIIYADPAWEVMAGSKQSRKEGDSQKSLPLTYPTMKLEEIKALPIKDIKAKEAIYFEARQILKENPNDPMAMSDYSAIIDNKISKDLNDRIVSLRQKMIVRSYIEESFI